MVVLIILSHNRIRLA